MSSRIRPRILRPVDLVVIEQAFKETWGQPQARGFRLGVYVFKDAEIVDYAAPYGVFSVARRFRSRTRLIFHCRCKATSADASRLHGASQLQLPGSTKYGRFSSPRRVRHAPRANRFAHLGPFEWAIIELNFINSMGRRCSWISRAALWENLNEPRTKTGNLLRWLPARLSRYLRNAF